MATGTLLKGMCYSHSNSQYYFIGFLIVKCRVFIRYRILENSPFATRNSPANVQVRVVQKMDSAIHWINIWETNCAVQWIEIYPMDNVIYMFV